MPQISDGSIVFSIAAGLFDDTIYTKLGRIFSMNLDPSDKLILNDLRERGLVR